MSAELNGLLKAVSRSFYLSLRFLPKSVRGELSLAYLLARASDSIADSATVAASERLELLNAFSRALHGDVTASFYERVAGLEVDHAGEAILLKRLAECFALLKQVEPHGLGLIRTVMGHILRGQSLDLQRFPGALQTDAELEEYTFLVAGCVGEFWSAMLAWKVPNWATLPDAEMIALGRTYGKGLQLVNILRDLPGDLKEGRTYLPGDDSMLARRNRWASVAHQWLDAGAQYVEHLNGWRLLFTADLPWRLGRETLQLLPTNDLQKVKISRAQVRSIMLGSAWRNLWKR